MTETTDTEYADAIFEAATLLNGAASNAVTAGLHVEFITTEYSTMDGRRYQSVRPVVSREISPSE
jgi:hypothetical protein